MTHRTLVVIPTYDERDNLEPLLGRIHASVGEADVLVVDDNSPDDTGALAQRLAADRAWLHVLHRPGKQGLGVAYLAGYGWGLAHGYDVFVQLDADLSHLPEQIPDLLAALHSGGGADLVIGTRWMPGGRVENWPRYRELLSRGGNRYTRIVLGLPLRDATGGFRALRRQVLERLDLHEIASAGYCFQVDLARRAVAAGCCVREVPIRFVERTRGESKMSGAVVRESLWRISAWGARYRMTRLRDVLWRHPDRRSR
ncbi:MAG: polyprenol monophosphomannose synthase [Actinomycetota bacterium]|nr:polyprenol monophosphomannose synthase [Actinomycetota bacterium]